jgi:aryl-phospho-beta-D-glucosidase BglC (GH1 family)
MEFIRAAGRNLYAGDVPLLLRGFGLGGWFLPEGYMWKLYKKCDRPRRMEAMIDGLCGKDYAAGFWENYLESYITEKDIKFIAEEGFNSIRLPLNGRHLYHIKDEERHINTRMFSKIDEVISWCRRHQIYLILDMHGAPGGQTGQNIDDSEADRPELFVQTHYVDELVFLWKELAKRYCEEPVIAGYDLLNEPLPNFFSQYNDKLLPL